MNQKEQKPRAVALYRASSKQQTEKKFGDDGMPDYDVPLQRQILVPWIERQGWEFKREFVEGGISGFKISAQDRDAVQDIKAMAIRKEFDILVIYMSDRLGRIADETPLIVSFLNSHGIKVMSYTDGEIKSTTHTDKLLTYIRYWQAEGESLKTSMRVCDALVQSVKAGRWRGGNLAYGYRAVSRGTLNFKGKPILDVEIDPEQAEVVKLIFRLARVDNFGIRRIATYLNDKNIPAQLGGKWTTTPILQVLNNPIYKGIYVLHSRVTSKERIVSPVMENFVIIPTEEWDATQACIVKRATREKGHRNTTHGKLLLSGLIYCGTCGKKMTTLGCKSKYVKKNGEQVYRKNYKYICSSFFTPQTEKCAGQHTFSAKKIDAQVVADVKEFLSTINGGEIIRSYLAKLDEDARIYGADLSAKQTAIQKSEAELARLKEEIVKALMGTSSFSEPMIKELLIKKELELQELKETVESFQNAILRIDALKCAHLELGHELDNWSELYDRHDEPRRKAMLLNVIDRVDVFRDRVSITYKIMLDTFDGTKNFDLDGGKCAANGTDGSETARLPQNCGMYSIFPQV